MLQDDFRHSVESEVSRLKYLYSERDNEFQIAKRKRISGAFALFFVAYYILFCVVARPTDFLSFILFIPLSLIASLVHFFVNASIFFRIADKSHTESRILRRIKWQLEHCKNYKLSERFIEKNTSFMTIEEERALNDIVTYGFWFCEASDD